MFNKLVEINKTQYYVKKNFKSLSLLHATKILNETCVYIASLKLYFQLVFISISFTAEVKIIFYESKFIAGQTPVGGVEHWTLRS